MTSVNVSEGVNEVIGRMVPSFNATSGAAVGPYRKSRLIHYPHFRLIAEEVAAVYPGLVTRTATGEVQTVRYQD